MGEKCEMDRRYCRVSLTLIALLKLWSKVWSDDCGAVLNCAELVSDLVQLAEGDSGKQTFLGAFFVPLRSLPPEPVYVLWVILS